MKRLLLLLPTSLLISLTAASFPRLASESATACSSCHINPNGTGMRNEYGNYSVAFNELTLQSTKKLVAKKYRSPRVADGLTVGFDTRHLIFDDGSTFRMQTDGYLNFEPFSDFYYHMRVTEAGITENYALLSLDDQRYCAKAGRFYPAFGLHTSDHKAYHRERTGHPSNFYADGLSLGASVEEVRVTLELLDQSTRSFGGLHVYRPFYAGPLSGLAGFSIRVSEEINGSNGSIPHAKAIFGSLTWDRFTLMCELDLVGKSNDTLISYANLSTRVIYGVYFITEYNFFDGNRDVKDGVEENVRLSVEFYPMPFVQLRPSYTYYTRGPLADEDDIFLQFHVGY